MSKIYELNSEKVTPFIKFSIAQRAYGVIFSGKLSKGNHSNISQT